MAKEKKSYIFKTTRRVGNQTFVGEFDKKRYKFPESGLIKGNSLTLKNLQRYIDRGSIEFYEGAVLEEYLDADEKTPGDIHKLLILDAQKAKIKEFNGKPIIECTTEELETALKSIEV